MGLHRPCLCFSRERLGMGSHKHKPPLAPAFNDPCQGPPPRFNYHRRFVRPAVLPCWREDVTPSQLAAWFRRPSLYAFSPVTVGVAVGGCGVQVTSHAEGARACGPLNPQRTPRMPPPCALGAVDLMIPEASGVKTNSSISVPPWGCKGFRWPPRAGAAFLAVLCAAPDAGGPALVLGTDTQCVPSAWF